MPYRYFRNFLVAFSFAALSALSGCDVLRDEFGIDIEQEFEQEIEIIRDAIRDAIDDEVRGVSDNIVNGISTFFRNLVANLFSLNDDSEADGDVFIEQIELPLLIFQTRTYPRLDRYGRLAEDYVFGNQSREQVYELLASVGMQYTITVGSQMPVHMLDLDVTQHRRMWRELASVATTTSIFSLRSVAWEMIDLFISGEGGYFSNDVLTERVKNHNDTQRYVNNVVELVQELIEQNAGNVQRLKFNYSVNICPACRASYRCANLMVSNMTNRICEVRGEFYAPSFNDFADMFNGLTFMIHSVWGHRIYLSGFGLHKDGQFYTGTLTFVLFDHFGLDESDIEDLSFWQREPGFASWYILQHYVGFGGAHRPFVTEVIFDVGFIGALSQN